MHPLATILISSITAVVATMVAAPARAACPRDLAIVDIAVVRPEQARVEPGQTVLVRCGRIVAIGPAARITPGPRMRRVPGRGRFLSPGLIDAHGHGNDIPWFRTLYLAHGVTSIRNPGGDDTARAAQAATAAWHMLGPYSYLATPPIMGGEPEWKTMSAPAAGRAIARRARADGYEYLKTYFQLSPEQFTALADGGEAEGLALIGHVPRSITLDQALAREWSIEHLTGFDDALEDPARHVSGPGSAMLTLRRFAVARRDAIPELARRVARSRVWQVPTLQGYQIWAEPDTMRAMATDPATIALVGRATLRRWAQSKPYYVIPLDQQGAADRAAIAAAATVRLEIVRALYQAGALLAVGTDAKELYVVPGLSMHQEMALYERSGIPRADILRMATINGALIARHADEVGTIAVGKRADLIVLAANPFDDLAVLARPVAVVANGVLLERGALDRMLADVAAEHAGIDAASAR